MCGIAGILRTGPDASLGALDRLTGALTHRGPDDEGFHREAGIGLGHRRLAIIDLNAGAQPLPNEDGAIWVVFNGEIYNYRELTAQLTAAGHRFRTESDTEVIVHAYEQWGVDCLQRLRGMFAFAVWDGRRQVLVLARDRVGIKPLCYFEAPGLFAFASEMHAFRALDEYRPTLDLQSLDMYLQFQYIPAPFSIYREVRKLPPAHYLEIDRHGRTRGPQRYWQLTFTPDDRVGEAEWLERLDAALAETIRLHLVSDVPCGAFLSGGVDSSTVVGYMARELAHPVKTFSIGFAETDYDERGYAREVAQRLGTEHYDETVRLDWDVFGELVRHYGEPFADSSSIPTYYVSRLAAAHVKVALSGDGGDEVFAGYPSYGNVMWAHRRPRDVVSRVRHAAGNALRAAGRRPALPTPGDTWYDWTVYFNEVGRTRLWRPEFHHLLPATRGWFDARMADGASADLCAQLQHFDLHNTLPYDMLTKVDIASMCHGLEVRVPLLDHVFLDIAARIPTRFNVRQDLGTRTFDGKRLLKRNAEQFLPPEFWRRRKQGFELPIRHWLDGELRGPLEERLLRSASHLDGLFDRAYVRELVAQHSPAHDHAPRLWSLLVLSEWLEQQRAPIAQPAGALA
jgi:asparagine synthase (glutamine-hydrolysing)